MNETWSALVDCWGEENARNACRLQIYITDKDEAANEQLAETWRVLQSINLLRSISAAQTSKR
jgi:hypothetical protein